MWASSLLAWCTSFSRTQLSTRLVYESEVAEPREYRALIALPSFALDFIDVSCNATNFQLSIVYLGELLKDFIMHKLLKNIIKINFIEFCIEMSN